MGWKTLKRRTRLNLIGALILMVGVGSAAIIYQRAGNNPYGTMGYEAADGTIYPLMPGNSKLYRHNLEVYGGKFSVIMDDCSRWFAGLWRGKSLAVIVGGTALIISLGFFYAANYLPRSLEPDEQPENNPEGTG